MNQLIKKIINLFISSFIVIIVLAFGMFYNDIRGSQVITQTDALSGQRIGVMSGWESDYFLSDRDDITLKRYDTTADLFMALNYSQVDALAIDTCLYALSLNSISNIKRVGNPLLSFEYTCYTSMTNPDILNNINEFIKIFKQSDEYDEFMEHYYDLEWIDSDDYTKPIGTGEVIKVGYVADYYPGVFITNDGEVKGSEAEFIVRFANYYNYQIDYVEVTESTYGNDLKYGKVDVCICSTNDLYRSELDSNVAFARMSDGFAKSDINCVVIDGKMSVDNGALFGDE